MLPIVNTNWNFRNNFYTLPTPPWLSTGYGEKYLYTLQLCTDLLMDKMEQAILIRLPGQGDVSQLPYLSYDRQLIQGTAESNANFIIRLQNFLDAWALAGSKRGILAELQAYIQNLQPGVGATMPEMTIVSGSWPTVAVWDQLYIGSTIGEIPTKTTQFPSNFNWDNKHNSWRSWLIFFLALVDTGQSGTTGETSSAAIGSYEQPGQLGSAVSQSGITYPAVWIPATSGTPVNNPFLTVHHLSGITTANVGQWITISGSSNPGNNGTFPIVARNSGTSLVIANPNGVINDTGPLTWSIADYPWIGPSPVWGAPGITFGEGEQSTPPLDYGQIYGGVWQPNPVPPSVSNAPSICWGLDTTELAIDQLRNLLKTWKSAGTYYPNIIFTYGGGTGVSGDEYSPNSTPGNGNPNGQFGSYGMIDSTGGILVPQTPNGSLFDAYCQGTGTWNSCSVQNIT